MNDEVIGCALIQQVQRATNTVTSCAASERDVVTLITLPMWHTFCRFAGVHECVKPSDSLGVFGSETRIIESDLMWSVSVAKERLKP